MFCKIQNFFKLDRKDYLKEIRKKTFEQKKIQN